MRRLVPLSAILLGLTCAPGGAFADELDGWCTEAKKASSIVICSDAQLREQAIARNKLFEAARAKLSPGAYKALSDDQSRWIKAYIARCGISIDDPPPAMPIPPSVINCYRSESRSRTAYLAPRLLPSPTLHQIPPPSAPESPSLSDTAHLNEIVNDALVRAGIPRPEVEALSAWDECTEHAADAFADQPEQAHTVAEAAMATCVREKAKYMLASGIQDPAAVENATIPHLIARVMAIRAARSKLREETPKARPAIDYNRM